MSMVRKIEVQSGGMLLLSVMVFFLDADMLAALLGNVLIHEWGHIRMLKRYGVYIRRIEIGFTGACIVCNTEYLPAFSVFASVAAGPFLGLVIAGLCSFFGNLFACDFLLLFAGVGIVLSLFNLLPVFPLDGGRMLKLVAPKLVRPIGYFCAFIILAVGLYIMACGFGTALACLGVFLLVQEENVSVDRGVC